MIKLLFALFRRRNQASSYGWVEFIQANIEACQYADQCYFCNKYISCFLEKFGDKTTELIDQRAYLILALNEKFHTLLEQEAVKWAESEEFSELTIDQLLK